MLVKFEINNERNVGVSRFTIRLRVLFYSDTLRGTKLIAHQLPPVGVHLRVDHLFFQCSGHSFKCKVTKKLFFKSYIIKVRFLFW